MISYYKMIASYAAIHKLE